MRYVVFLYLIALISLTQVHEVQASNTFTFDNYDVIIRRHSNESGSGYHIEKTGESPFEMVLFDEGVSYYLNDVTVSDNYIMMYGYSHDDTKETYYDGFFYMMKTDGSDTKKTIIDFQMLEEVKGAYFVNGMWMFHVDVSLDENREIKENGSYMMLFDKEGKEVNRSYFHKRILEVEESDVGVVLNEEYTGEFDWLYTTAGEKISKENSIQLEHNGVYYGSVSLHFVGNAMINGEVYQHGTILRYPGHYEFKRDGETVLFTIHPIIEGITDDQVTPEPINFSVSSGQVFINDDLYTGNSITTPGTYNVTIRGVGQYEKSLQFTITSNVSGVINDAVYQDDILIHFNGEGYLNNRFIESPYTITEPGDYTLTIQGENHYSEQYTFELIAHENDFSIIDFIQRFDIIVFVVVVLSGVLLWKKKS